MSLCLYVSQCLLIINNLLYIYSLQGAVNMYMCDVVKLLISCHEMWNFNCYIHETSSHVHKDLVMDCLCCIVKLSHIVGFQLTILTTLSSSSSSSGVRLTPITPHMNPMPAISIKICCQLWTRSDTTIAPPPNTSNNSVPLTESSMYNKFPHALSVRSSVCTYEGNGDVLYCVVMSISRTCHRMSTYRVLCNW